MGPSQFGVNAMRSVYSRTRCCAGCQMRTAVRTGEGRIRARFPGVSELLEWADLDNPMLFAAYNAEEKADEDLSFGMGRQCVQVEPRKAAACVATRRR